jgi:hypothetical protein
MTLNIDYINDILNDLWNLHLVLFGVGLTVFTLLYSFILNKRDELRSISDEVKRGNNSPMLAQREDFAISYITRLKKANKHSFIAIIITFCLFVSGWISERIILDSAYNVKLVCFWVISFSSCVVLIYIGLIILKMHKHYILETRI